MTVSSNEGDAVRLTGVAGQTLTAAPGPLKRTGVVRAHRA